MGVATGIALAATAASVAGSAISAKKQADAQKDLRDQQTASIADLARIRQTLVADALSGEFENRYSAGDIFGRRPEELDISDAVRRSALGNLANMNLNQTLTERVNEATTEESIRRAAQFDPNFRVNVRDLGDQARSLIRGEIPQDVLGQVYRNRAEFGAASGLIGAQGPGTARDLGLTSLDLQNRGLNLFREINAIRDSVDPVSRQLAQTQLLTSPSQQLEVEAANNVIRSSPDPIARDIFNLQLQGSREEAFARGNVKVPVNNTLGAGLSAAGGGLTGLLSGGFLGSSRSSGLTPVVPAQLANQ